MEDCGILPPLSQVSNYSIMQPLTQKVIRAGLRNRVITDSHLKRLLDGSDQRRYHMVSRAIKAGELIRLRPGLYVLVNELRDNACHPYALAQMLVPGSYVSLESALSFHGWIPEAVYTTISIVPGRRAKKYSPEPFGQFTFSSLAIHQGHFLELVNRVQINKQTFLLASPVRAFMDLVCIKKIQWQGLAWIEQGMRIDNDVWAQVTRADLRTLKRVYKHARVQEFLSKLEIALGLELGYE